MEIKVLEKKKNKLKLEIIGENHTFCNSLRKELWNDKAFKVEIIAFGTHLKKEYGNTIDEINNLGFVVEHKIETLTIKVKNRERLMFLYEML